MVSVSSVMNATVPLRLALALGSCAAVCTLITYSPLTALAQQQAGPKPGGSEPAKTPAKDAAGAPTGATAATTITPAEVAAKIDEHLAALEPKGFCGVALFTVNGKEYLHKAYGLADRESKRRATIDTGWCIGSIVKPMTKAAVVKLASQGKLALDDKITKHFDNVPPDKADITIQHLLDHTSGLEDIFGDDYEIVSRDWVVQKAMASTLQSKPGEKNSYSNAGYSLLGAIIEQTSGKPYERYVYDEILSPAGVKRIGYLIPKWKNEELAVGYQDGKRWGTPLDHAWADDGPSWNLRANGGMIATARELHTWFEAMYAGRVLDSAGTETFKKMTLRPSRSGGHAIGVAGGNGISNSIHLMWFEAGVSFTCFSSVAELQAEDVLKPIREVINPLLTPKAP